VDENGYCNWERKLCVTCSEYDEGVYILVQTNALPDRCFGDKNDLVPKALDLEFEVKFNWNPANAGEVRYTPVNVEELTELICDSETNDKDLTPDEAGYVGSRFAHKGISLDGLPIMSGANA